MLRKKELVILFAASCTSHIVASAWQKTFWMNEGDERSGCSFATWSASGVWEYEKKPRAAKGQRGAVRFYHSVNPESVTYHPFLHLAIHFLQRGGFGFVWRPDSRRGEAELCQTPTGNGIPVGIY